MKHAAGLGVVQVHVLHGLHHTRDHAAVGAEHRVDDGVALVFCPPLVPRGAAADLEHYQSRLAVQTDATAGVAPIWRHAEAVDPLAVRTDRHSRLQQRLRIVQDQSSGARANI